MKGHHMSMRQWAVLPLVGASIIGSAALLYAQAPAFAPPQVAFVEENITTLRPSQQRVIVPVREQRTVTRLQGWWNPFREPQLVQRQVPVTRWEERIQTNYTPVTQRRFRPVIETSARQMPPLILATRPEEIAARGSQQLLDDLPMVAMDAPPARTAQTPTSTLVPQTYKPAARSPSNGLRPLTPR